MNFEVFSLGTSGMMPLPGRNLTSALVRREGEMFLFDCGEGTIYGPTRLGEYIDSSRRILDMYINYDIHFIPVEEGAIYENDEFTVNCFMLRHTKICYGYSLVEKQRAGAFSVEAALAHRVPRGPLWSKLQHGLSVMNEDGLTVTPDMVLGPKRDGRKFTYITDTMYFPELSDYAHDSDILFCEGMFDSSLEDDARQKKHMTAAQAAMVARDGNVGRLCLQHYSPRYSDRELKTLAAEARAIFPETVLTRDRMSFEIPLKD